MRSLRVILVLVLLLAVCCWQVFQDQQQTLADLQERNDWLEHERIVRRQQLAQMSALAETRYQELSRELAEGRAEQALLWKRLGRVHPAPLASRGGRRMRYLELQRQVAADRLERTQLEQAAQARIPEGAPCQGEMTSPFGLRSHPILGVGRPHKGCDFTTDFGTPIRATAEGTVLSSGWLGGYGQAVEIDHGFGVVTLYAHCSELRVVKGQRVERGQVIGAVGMTGLASGPHCHYEVHFDGKAVDPARYLGDSASQKTRRISLEPSGVGSISL